MLQKTANSILGALSLSEVCDHELMWSHYAEEHKGFVIGFECSHSFFNQQKSASDELRHLRKIEYRERPPVINLMNTNATELFFVKSKKWEYEAEWRMVLPLTDATKVVEKNPYPIHLHKFPAESIKQVIIGARASDNSRTMIRSLVTNKEFSHTELYSAHLDSSSYGIIINKNNG